MKDGDMNTTVRLLLTMIALLSMVNRASADSGREDVEALRAEVVLEAGEIDSSTVEVGALAVVVYEREEQNSLPGARARLDTARGYIKAVDQRRLIAGLEPDGWSKWIALERIQVLVLVGSPSPDAIARANALAATSADAATVATPFPSSEDQDSTQADSGRVEGKLTEMPDRLSARTAERIALKLRNGVIASGIFQFGGIVLIGSDSIAGPFPGAIIGSAVGAVVGVLRVDPPARSRNFQKLFMSLAGSWIGAMVAGLVTSRDTYYGLPDALALLVCPAVGATIATELWRKPIPAAIKSKPEASRFSIGLVPTPKRGRLSAVVTLRF
jgi:hypothetical protein